MDKTIEFIIARSKRQRLKQSRMNTYECADCGGTFEHEDDWTDEDAKAEADENGYDVADCAIVCDDCYKRFRRNVT